MTIGAVVISRNDGYGGGQPEKSTYCLTSLIEAMDEVVYVDWNSPDDISLIELIRDDLPKTGKLRAIKISRDIHNQMVGSVPGVQKCVEVLARNIGIRRLSTDYIISTNHDIVCLDRDSITSRLKDPTVFHCVARREVGLLETKDLLALGFARAQAFLKETAPQWKQHGDGSPLGPSDKWSLITSPGDFQIAHTGLWGGIRGFEESLLFRGYADSNVQRKADFYGFDLRLTRDIPVFHFEHYPDTGSCGGGVGPVNDRGAALENFNGSTNPPNWGFGGVDLETEII